MSSAAPEQSDQQEYIVRCPCTSRLGAGCLILTLNVRRDVAANDDRADEGDLSGHFSPCVKRLTADLSLRLNGSEKDDEPLKIGQIQATIFDETVKAATRVDDKSVVVEDRDDYASKSQPAIHEQQESTLVRKRYLLSARTEASPYNSGNFFDECDSPQTDVNVPSDISTQEKLCWISLVILDPGYRGFGLGSISLNLFLMFLTTLPAPDTYEGPAYLMPGLADFRAPKEVLEISNEQDRLQTVERLKDEQYERLLAFYEKNGVSMRTCAGGEEGLDRRGAMVMGGWFSGMLEQDLLCI